ncbi:collagen, type I, alpha 1a-like [Pogoniulus pusillus]|uniref:collagen, type I, alpha 1a-like n=1 Tax=Pogoniulus pusillus TaxID=488313 RepID=UPI0030B9455A
MPASGAAGPGRGWLQPEAVPGTGSTAAPRGAARSGRSAGGRGGEGLAAGAGAGGARGAPQPMGGCARPVDQSARGAWSAAPLESAAEEAAGEGRWELAAERDRSGCERRAGAGRSSEPLSPTAASEAGEQSRSLQHREAAASEALETPGSGSGGRAGPAQASLATALGGCRPTPSRRREPPRALQASGRGARRRWLPVEPSGSETPAAAACIASASPSRQRVQGERCRLSSTAQEQARSTAALHKDLQAAASCLWMPWPEGAAPYCSEQTSQDERPGLRRDSLPVPRAGGPGLDGKLQGGIPGWSVAKRVGRGQAQGLWFPSLSPLELTLSQSRAVPSAKADVHPQEVSQSSPCHPHLCWRLFSA